MTIQTAHKQTHSKRQLAQTKRTPPQATKHSQNETHTHTHTHKQVWRLVTPAFLHAGILHLLINMHTLFILGFRVEYSFGSTTLLLCYLLGSLTGNIFSAYFSPSTISLGASSSILALLGLQTARLIAFWSDIDPLM